MFLNRQVPLISLFRSKIELTPLLRSNLLFLLIFFASSLRRLRSFVVFWIECCHSDHRYLTSFIFFWAISMIVPRFMTFKTTIVLFIFYFRMRALVSRRRVKVIIWLVILFEFIEMTGFVRLLISIKLIIKEFATLMLIITVAVIFTRATQCNLLHNNFK